MGGTLRGALAEARADRTNSAIERQATVENRQNPADVRAPESNTLFEPERAASGNVQHTPEQTHGNKSEPT